MVLALILQLVLFKTKQDVFKIKSEFKKVATFLREDIYLSLCVLAASFKYPEGDLYL